MTKRLNIERTEAPSGVSWLRIESTWNKRATITLDEEEMEELCEALQRLCPEHFGQVYIPFQENP